MLFTFLVSFGVTFLAVPMTIWLSKSFNAIDHPEARRVHTQPTGRLGGIAIYLGVMIALLLNAMYYRIDLLPYFLGSLVIIIIGIWDDIVSLHPLVKLVGQITAASILLYLGVKVEVISTFHQGEYISLGMLKFPLTLFWIVSITNMINFLDGLDGLAAGITVIAAAALIFVNIFDKLSPVSILMLTALAGSSLAFLRFNWHPAKIFMGDTGSMFLGFSIGVSSVLGAFKGATLAIVLVPFLVLLLPIFDMIFAIFRRVTRDAPIFKPDKEHLHHQFLKRGFSHQSAVLFIYLISTFLGVSAIFISRIKTILAAFMMVSVTAILAFFLILFFTYFRKKMKVEIELEEKSENLIVEEEESC
jgi:UDP-GlcNAc:undecaprenyl-phosphate GlcNAc-1-phosphate transferase